VAAGDDVRPPVLRGDDHDEVRRLMADPGFARLEWSLRRYLAWTLPAPRRTERDFWTVSAFPASGDGWHLFALTVHSVDTLVVYAPAGQPEVTGIRLTVDLFTILDRWGSLERFTDQLLGMHAEPRSGTAAVWVDSPRDLVRLLTVDGVVTAARRLHLDLMRRGPAPHRRSRSAELADRLLTPVDTPRPAEPADAQECLRRGAELDDQGRFEEAEPLYRRAAEAGHGPGMNLLGHLLLVQGRPQESEQWWRRGADAGDLDCMDMVGFLCDFAGEPDRAEQWWHRAADAGHSDAMISLGLLLRDRGDLAGAQELLRRAVESGDETTPDYIGALLVEPPSADTMA
jgi:hypothetical protein